ncbi:F-box protein At5g07610-like [Hordeum vulgare subsp. vulgare]|uniref:F-box protein At5g07610-like n=1 Tax=Hordeum vulgare subsp. vulgare TaxID=112509 RepID=UPI001D1A49C6|nr:F-box protein At5g07610-like [Hordeum vulgare subsp. vulgare]
MSVPSDRSRPSEDGCASTRVRSYSPPHGGTAAERLADDMLVEILSRVPARSVCRFKCVSKHWLSLIDHPDHRKKLPQTLAGFFYTRSDNGQLPLETEVRFVSVSGKRGPPVDTSFAFLPSHGRVDLLDCCNGLLLCRWYAVSAPDDEFRYIVCNPAREEWVELPDTSHADNVRREALHLGFDPVVSPHFYVFAFLEDAHFNFYLAGVEVYSSETRRWVYKEIGWSKRIKLAARQSDAVFLNGCLHFYASGKISPFYIGVIDKEGEIWARLCIPGDRFGGFIQQSQGRLHYANFKKDHNGDVVRLVVYVLEDYNSKKWKLKDTVETSDIFAGTNVTGSDRLAIHSVDSCWIATHPQYNLIFFTVGSASTLMCYDMDRQQVKVIRNHDGYQPRLPYVPFYGELQSLHA